MKFDKLFKSVKVEFKNVRLNLLNSTSFVGKNEYNIILGSLREKGYYVLENYYSSEWCSKAIDEIDKLIVDYNDNIWKDSKESDHRLYGANIVSQFLKDYYEEELIRNLIQTYEGY